jgi:hypothetical protein
LKEVEGRVSEALRREKQKEKALAKAKELLEKLTKGEDFKSLASKEGLKISETGLFQRGSAPPKMSPSEELQKALASLSPKNPYPEAPLLQEDKYFILRLKEKKEVDRGQFDSQKDNYRRGLIMLKQQMVLTSWLEGILERAKAKGEYKMIQEANEVI